MTGLQQFFLGILPRSIGQAMEKESRLWMLTCPDCGRETSVWDAGGIRHLAAGRPRRRIVCPSCGPRWHTVVKKDAPIVGPTVKSAS